MLSWAALGIAAGILLVSVVIPRFGGGTAYAVLTGSMRPSLPEGTLVVTRPSPPRSVGLGDVITYQLTSGQSAVVTHRVVRMTASGTEPMWQTQGDANDTPDAAWVRPVQLRGSYWYSVPELGRLYALLHEDRRRQAAYLCSALLGGYAVVMMWRGLLDRRSREPVGG